MCNWALISCAHSSQSAWLSSLTSPILLGCSCYSVLQRARKSAFASGFQQVPQWSEESGLLIIFLYLIVYCHPREVNLCVFCILTGLFKTSPRGTPLLAVTDCYMWVLVGCKSLCQPDTPVWVSCLGACWHFLCNSGVGELSGDYAKIQPVIYSPI